MEKVTGQQAEVNQLWEGLKPEVDALITERINLFYDALMNRKQIPPMPPPEIPTEY